MAGNSGDSTHAHSGDVDCLVIDGVEYLAKPYSGCSKCATSEERLPFYEVSMKESMEGKKRKYPIRSDISLNSCSDTSFSLIADQMKHLTGQLRVLKDNNCPTQNTGKINVRKPSINELERVINTIEVYVSSLKSKLMKYRDEKSHQSRGDTLEPLYEVTEVGEEEMGPENNETVLSGDETTVVRNELSDVGREMRSKLNVKDRTKNVFRPAKARRDKVVSDQETESSDSEVELICDDNESVDVEVCKSSDDELSKVNRVSVYKQARETSRRKHSSGKDISYVHDHDNSCAELEIHSGVHGSSSVKGRISIRKHHINDDKFEDDRSKDAEEEHPPEKRHRGPEEDSAARHSPIEFSENYPGIGSQVSVESETTESSLYETAKDISSQDSEVLHDSSGSATP